VIHLRDFIRRPLLLVACLIVMAGCATTSPRVLEVTRSKYVSNIRPEDERVFARDRASHFRTEIVSLPAEQQREMFFVRWNSAAVRSVKFEYRQVDKPDQIGQQRFAPARQSSHTFVIHGEEFLTGGAVSAWRVSLWSPTDELLAESKSALW